MSEPVELRVRRVWLNLPILCLRCEYSVMGNGLTFSDKKHPTHGEVFHLECWSGAVSDE